MMTCREATRLMSEGRERTLTLREKSALLFHTGLCGACRRFNRQIDVVSRLAREYARGIDGSHSDEATDRKNHK